MPVLLWVGDKCKVETNAWLSGALVGVRPGPPGARVMLLAADGIANECHHVTGRHELAHGEPVEGCYAESVAI